MALKLSEGSLDLIIEQGNQNLRPILQILGGKKMANNNHLRIILYDGRTIYQYCIMTSEEIQTLFNEGKLEKFTVVRLEQYSVSSFQKKENILVILVQKLEILKQGDEIGRKLEPNELIATSNTNVMDTSVEMKSNTSSSNLNETINNNNSTVSKSVEKKSSTIVPDDVEIRPENVCPISVLTPFFNAWIIRALCINKGTKRTYNNQRGQGCVFNFDVCDDTGEIRITCFNDECNRFYDLIEKDRCYYIGRGSIKSANRKFSTVNNDYEITLSQNSFVKPCLNGNIDAPKLRYKFIQLARISTMNANLVVDVIGVIRSVNEIETLISKKTSKELLKREVVIVDKSMAEVRLTLWGDSAQTFTGQPNDVIALKGVSIGDFKGKTLTARDSTNIQINPELPEKDLLQHWYSTLNQDDETFNQLSKSSSDSTTSNNRFIAQILPNKLNEGETLNFHTTAIVQAYNRINNHLYKACGFNNCQKKVNENDGTYYCSKCDRSSAMFDWRLMINVLLTDVSGSFWVTVFQDQAEKLLGKNVNELSKLYEEDQNLYVTALDEIRFKQYQFRIYTRLDNYNNEIRMRHTVGQIMDLKPKKFINNLIQSIELMTN